MIHGLSQFHHVYQKRIVQIPPCLSKTVYSNSTMFIIKGYQNKRSCCRVAKKKKTAHNNIFVYCAVLWWLEWIFAVASCPVLSHCPVLFINVFPIGISNMPMGFSRQLERFIFYEKNHNIIKILIFEIKNATTKTRLLFRSSGMIEQLQNMWNENVVLIYKLWLHLAQLHRMASYWNGKAGSLSIDPTHWGQREMKC